MCQSKIAYTISSSVGVTNFDVVHLAELVDAPQYLSYE